MNVPSVLRRPSARSATLGLALCALAAGCREAREAPPPPVVSAPSGALAAFAEDPGALVALMASSPEAWPALSAGRALAALEAFERALGRADAPNPMALRVGAARAALDGAAVLDPLARAQAHVLAQLRRHPEGRSAAARFGAALDGPPAAAPGETGDWPEDARATAGVAEALGRRAAEVACAEGGDRPVALLCVIARARLGDRAGAAAALADAVLRPAPSDWLAATAWGGWPDGAAAERAMVAGSASPALGPCPYEPAGACDGDPGEEAILAEIGRREQAASAWVEGLRPAVARIARRMELAARAPRRALLDRVELHLRAGRVEVARRLMLRSPLGSPAGWVGAEGPRGAALAVWAAVLDGDPQAAHDITHDMADRHPVWAMTGRMIRLWAMADLARSAPSFNR